MNAEAAADESARHVRLSGMAQATVADAPSRALPSLSRLATPALAVVPGALIVYFAFNSGGYYAASVGLAAVELCLLVAVRFGVARRPWAGIGIPLVLAATALGAFAAWALASQGWSHSPFRATVEYDRALFYLLLLVFFGSFAFSVRRVRWLVYGVAAAIVVVCGAAFVTRTLPEVIPYEAVVHPERLAYPLSYWNSLGILTAIGIVLCGHLACSLRDAWPARVLGAAAVPLLATVLYYTFSRGATWAAVGGVVLYVLAGRPRGILSGAIATAPAAAVALATASPSTSLIHDPYGPDGLATGHRVAITVALCMLGAAALRALLLPLDRRLDALELSTRVRRPVIAVGTAGLLAVVLAGCATFEVPSLLADKYEEFTSDEERVGGAGSSRLLQAGDNGRRDHWDVAMAAFRAEPGHGTGAGTWGLEWNRERETQARAQDAHSLYYEVLAELGLPGIVLLGVVLLLVLGAFAWRARGPDKAVFAALLAAGAAWAAHAAVDWDWEMPAVTLWLFAAGGAALARRPREAEGSPASWTIGLRVAAIAACAAVAVLPARVALSETHYGDSVDALTVQDCRTAVREARNALEPFGDRAAPYHAIAYCRRLVRDWDGAVRPMALALREDPGDWELWRGLAIARAAAGHDPRRAARRALRLNPNDPLAQDTAATLGGAKRRAWVRRGRAAWVPPPEIGDR